MRAGHARDDVRNAVSQLWDRGVIRLGVDRKLHNGEGHNGKELLQGDSAEDS